MFKSYEEVWGGKWISKPNFVLINRVTMILLNTICICLQENFGRYLSFQNCWWSKLILACKERDNIQHQNTEILGATKDFQVGKSYIFFLLSSPQDTIPGPSDSIGAPKMYILEKNILGTQISMLGGATILCFAFSTRVPKNGPKNAPKFKKRRKMTKTISHFSEILYKDKS